MIRKVRTLSWYLGVIWLLLWLLQFVCARSIENAEDVIGDWLDAFKDRDKIRVAFRAAVSRERALEVAENAGLDRSSRRLLTQPVNAQFCRPLNNLFEPDGDLYDAWNWLGPEAKYRWVDPRKRPLGERLGRLWWNISETGSPWSRREVEIEINYPDIKTAPIHRTFGGGNKIVVEVLQIRKIHMRLRASLAAETGFSTKVFSFLDFFLRDFSWLFPFARDLGTSKVFGYDDPENWVVQILPGHTSFEYY
ncbi:MAG: hypothetical protein GMKNLPBB_00346 [Myxococcota bacterium]|nr:hypothetical protein [Myxococcota bacterium]